MKQCKKCSGLIRGTFREPFELKPLICECKKEVQKK